VNPASTTVLVAAKSQVVAECEDRLHTVRSGLAGLAGALQVLTDFDADLPETSRRRVEALVLAEVERLRRVATPSAVDGRGDGDVVGARSQQQLDLDSVVADIVLARRMAGQQVTFEPSGQQVLAVRDDLVEVLNILLTNAARHAPGSRVTVAATGASGSVRVSVTDDGPGVPPELRDTIFERGRRRADSPGQGLGLAIARELMQGLGGLLRLEEHRDVGARFVLELRRVAMDGAA
jgi:signal transduction histidine kinase